MFPNHNMMMGGSPMMQQPMQQVMSDWPSNTLIIHPQNFNFNPQNTPIPNFPVWMPEVQNAIPTIAASIANEICRTATVNTIRVYTYNQLSANNFSNPDFAQVVQLAVDLLSLRTRERGGFGAFNQDAERSVKDAIIIKASMNVANSPALASTVPPPTLREINNTLLIFKNDAAKIEQFRAMAMNQPQQQQRGNFNNPLGNPAMMQNQNNGFVQQQFNQPVQQQQFNQFQNNQNQQFQPTQFGNQQNQNNSGYRPVNPVSPNSMNVVARDFSYPEFVPIEPANQFAAPSQPQQQNVYTPVTNFQPVPAPAPAILNPSIPPAPPPLNPAFNTSIDTKAGIIESWDSTPEANKSHHQAFRMPEIRQTPKVNDELSTILDQVTAELQSPLLDFAEPGNPVKVIETNESLYWRPSELQPFPIYWESLKEKIILKKVSYKGKIFIVQQKTNLTEEEMDELRHAIGPKTIMDKAVLDQQRERLIEVVGLEEGRVARTGPKIETIDGVVTVSEILNPTTQDEFDAIMESGGPQPKNPEMAAFPSLLKLAGLDKEPTQTVDGDGDPAWSDAGFLADSIYSTKVRHLTMANSHKRIRREYHIVPKVFVSNKPLDDIFNEWTEKKSFTFLADKLRRTVNGDKLATKACVEFAAEFDRYLTNIVNEYMNNILHVTTKIDSFCEDIDDLMGGYLKDKYGPFIHDALIEYQQEFYDRYLTRIEDEEMLKAIVEMHVNEDDVDADTDTRDTYVLVLENNYSISSIRIHSSELKLTDTKSGENTPTPIGDDRPELKAFCEILFDSKIVGEFNWTKHLLITSDGQIYSVEKPTVGYIKYMIRKLNPMWLLP